ncbi:MAG: hydroxymethylbilane synthase [Pyrobaculum sp.]
MKIVVATRGSRLSLLQTQELIEQIKAVEPELRFEIKVVKTTGDIIQEKPLYQIGVKGIFEKEVNLAVLNKEADMAVHSLKDLPSVISDGLVLAGFSRRASPHDAVVSPQGYDLSTLPKGAVVGTSSIRRAEFLKSARPDVHIEPLRGNVDTRVNKILNGRYHAAVMAMAGLLRLYGDSMPVRAIPIRPEVLPPPPGQGIVVAVAKEGESWLIDLLKKASDFKSTVEALAEREFLAAVGAGCHVAIGGLAVYKNEAIELTAGYASSGRRYVVKTYGVDPIEVGRRAAKEINRIRLSLGHSLHSPPHFPPP